MKKLMFGSKGFEVKLAAILIIIFSLFAGGFNTARATVWNIDNFNSLSNSWTSAATDDVFDILDTITFGGVLSSGYSWTTLTIRGWTNDAGGHAALQTLDGDNGANYGFIITDKTMIFSDLIFEKFTRTKNTNGGAINASASTITFNEQINFISNGATYGGAISLTGSLANFTNSTVSFIGNTAASNGGAIYLDSSSASFTNSTVSFLGNTAIKTDNTGSGGAIYLTGVGGSYNINPAVNFTDSIVNFISNVANGINNYGGGAVYLTYNARANFTNSTVSFISNISADGGAIYLHYSSTATFINSIVNFANNIATARAGAIFINGYSHVNFVNSTVSFTGNISDFLAGAIYFTDSSSAAFVNSIVNFTSNTSLSGGGVMYLGGRNQLNFTNSTVSFIGNVAAEGSGGALYVNQAISLTFNKGQVDFTSNAAKGGSNNNGGAIYLINNSTANFIDLVVSFTSNSSAYNGGAIYLNKSHANFENSIVNFTSNTGRYGGGAFYLTGAGGLASFINSTVSFIGNLGGNGGAISLDDGAKVNFENSLVNFTSNTSTGSGGALILYDAQLTFTNSAVNFTSNTSLYDSGAGLMNITSSHIDFIGSIVNFIGHSVLTSREGPTIRVYGVASLNFTNSTVSFINNGGGGNGGAIFLNTESSPSSFANSIVSFISNYSGRNAGGAIYVAVYNSGVTFINSTVSFISNSAGEYGGAISIGMPDGDWANSQANFESSIVNFTSNTAGSLGGAIYLVNTSQANFTDSIVNFTSNTSSGYGGAIFFDYTNSGNNLLSFVNSTINFIGNTAAEGGGAIYLNGGSKKVIFDNSIINFTSNTAVGAKNRGGIYAAKGDEVIFTNSTISFMGNSGAIDQSASAVTFGNSIVEFIGNYVEGSGGAINLGEGGSALSFTNSTVSFTGNNSVYGGAVNVNNSIATFVNSTISFTRNIAVNSGGALNITDGGLGSFSNAQVNFTSNSVSQWTGGGAVYVGGGSNISFDKSTANFVNNFSSLFGGAIALEKSLVIFNESQIRFTSNTVLGEYGAGGAVYLNNSGEINFKDSTVSFMGNELSGNGGKGGALYVFFNAQDAGNFHSSLVSFANSDVDFTSNSAGGGSAEGGAVWLAGNSQINFNNSNVNFTSNSAAGANAKGGAVWLAEYSQIIFNNSNARFIDNIAGNQGGAISASGAGSQIILNVGPDNEIFFSGNKINDVLKETERPNDIYIGNGARLLITIGASGDNHSGKVSLLEGIEADGGIFSYMGTDTSKYRLDGYSLIIGGENIFDNSAISISYGKMLVENATWTFENAYNVGMNITNASSVSFVNTESRFESNKIDPKVTEVMLQINRTSNVLFSGLTIFENNSDNYIFVDNTSLLTFRGDVRFINNSVSASGLAGAIYNNGTVTFDITGATVTIAGTQMAIYNTGTINITGNDASGFFEIYGTGGADQVIRSDYGYGTIKKDSAGILFLAGDARGYMGRYEQTAGTTQVNYASERAEGYMFGGDNIISNSLLQVISVDNNINYRVSIGDNGRLEHYTPYSNSAAIIRPSNIRVTGKDGKITFARAPGTSQTNRTLYLLEDKIEDDQSGNEVIFNGGYLMIGGYISRDGTKDFTGTTKYVFNDSAIALTKWDSTRSTWTVVFTNMEVNNSVLALNIDIVISGGVVTFVYDQLNVTNFSVTSGLGLGLSAMQFINIEKDVPRDSLIGQTFNIQVLFGNAIFDYSNMPNTVAISLDDLMGGKYDITMTAAQNIGAGPYQSLSLAFASGSIEEANTLYDFNNMSISREFKIGKGVYISTRSLGVTGAASGDRKFEVNGGPIDGTDGPKDHILSGATTTYMGAWHSLFNLVNETNLHVTKLTITSAAARGGDIEAGSNPYGPVLRMSHANATALFEYVIIADNYAEADGGAFYLTGGKEVTVGWDSEITRNRAGARGGVIDPNVSPSSGGAIYAKNVTSLRITATSVTYNETTADGGGIYLDNTDVLIGEAGWAYFGGNRAGVATAENKDFANGLGGAIYAGNGSTLRIISANSEVKFENNTMVVDGNRVGNDIYIDNSELILEADKNNAIYIKSGIIANNSTIRMIGNNGFHIGGQNIITDSDVLLENGTLFLEGATLSLINDSGGTFNIGSDTPGQNTKIVMTNSEIEVDGKEDIVFYRNNVNNMTASEYSAVLTLNKSKAVFHDNVIFSQNTTHGGGIIAVIGSEIIFDGDEVRFENNLIEDTAGGLLFWNGSASKINFTDTNLYVEGNVVRGDRGGIFWYDAGYGDKDIVFNGIVHASTNTIGDGTSTGYGGVFYMNISNMTMNKAVYFGENFAGAGGGAFYMVGGARVDFMDLATFYANKTSNDGGAMYIGRGSRVSFTNGVEFEANTAGNRGGAIYNEGYLDFIASKDNDISFVDNMAAQGSNIYNAGTINFDTTKGLITIDGIYADANSVINKYGSNDLTIIGTNYISGQVNINNAIISISGDEGTTEFVGGIIRAGAGGHLDISRTGGVIAFEGTTVEAAMKINQLNTVPIVIRGDRNTTMFDVYDDSNNPAVIEKTGSGNWLLKQADIKGKVDVQEGRFEVGYSKAGDVSITTLTVAQGAVLGFSQHNALYVGADSAISGTIEINIDALRGLGNKVIIENGILDIEGADWTTRSYLDGGGQKTSSAEIEIFDAESASAQIQGKMARTSGQIVTNGRVWVWEIEESNNNFPAFSANAAPSNANGISLNLHSYAQPVSVGGISHNQKEANDILYRVIMRDNTPEGAMRLRQVEELMAFGGDKKALEKYLEELSGSFLANVLMTAGTDVNADGIYNNIRDDIGLGINVWGEINGGMSKSDNNNVMGSFDVTGGNAYAGTDLYVSQKERAGIYVGGVNKSLSQGDNSGSISGFEAGLYGGIFRDRVNAKIKAGIEIDDIKTQRKIEGGGISEKVNGNVEATTVKMGAEAEFDPSKLFMEKRKKGFRIFGRLDASLTSNGTMREKYKEGDTAALRVDESNYARLKMALGGKYIFSVGGVTLTAKGYMGIMPVGSQARYTMSFNEVDATEMDIESAKMAKVFAGAAIAGQYQINEAFALSANINGSGGVDENGYNIAGGLGANYKFGGTKKENRKTANTNVRNAKTANANTAVNKSADVNANANVNKSANTNKNANAKKAANRQKKKR
jgi:predicted outer membrane repeat protein